MRKALRRAEALTRTGQTLTAEMIAELKTLEADLKTKLEAFARASVVQDDLR